MTRRPPIRVERCGGTAGMTSVGMFGHHPGWGIPVSPVPLMVTVAGITAHPRAVGGAVVLRLTVSFDHDVIDGAPAVRFVTRFLDRVEAGYGLPTDEASGVASTETLAAEPM
jgi:pyruvate/2-oxoglutarate dehydrogenase complex dihydrolipoamide acyltransferase (E2) component